jgi:hypothetical protein
MYDAVKRLEPTLSASTAAACAMSSTLTKASAACGAQCGLMIYTCARTFRCFVNAWSPIRVQSHKVEQIKRRDFPPSNGLAIPTWILHCAADNPGHVRQAHCRHKSDVL